MSEPMMIITLINFRRRARAAGCRIKRWKLTEDQANILLDEINPWAPRSQELEKMRRGYAHLFGAQIVVTP